MLWEEIIAESERRGAMANQVFQEEVQKAVLASLSRGEAFNHLVFQGGTALRLFYGNPRFSEDLDFVLKQNETFDLTESISNIQAFVEDTFPFTEETNISIQRNDARMQRLILKISGKPFRRIRVHIELAYVPSYHNKPKILDYPPINPVVRVEEAHEILADKLTALGNRPYIKGRDIWDIYFLTTEKNITIPWHLVFQKVEDYGTTSSNLKKNILKASKRLEKEGLSILHNEMLRFLPKKFLDQYSEIFEEIVTIVVGNVRGGILEK
jgi:predicted nucleotidyltransferase component of viral defense system